jgi:sensor histidine kinase YesM
MSGNPFTGKQRLTLLHLLVWTAVLVISFFSMLPADGPRLSLLSSLNECFFYALIIYGNISYLYPRFYKKKQYGPYLLGAAILLLIGGLGHGYISSFMYNPSFAAAPHLLDARSTLRYLLPATTVFILSFVFRLAMAYFVVKRQSEEILLRHSQFELKLLKSQVQPHFLFNTLNTIYYEAYIEAPRAALLIEKLSDIMRYFVDHSSKEYVRLSTEIEFIDNYIALEKIRINPQPEIEFSRNIDGDRDVPPMLLMPFVENIFKHGVDKITGVNRIRLSLDEDDRYLVFRTGNLINRHASPREGEGLGLTNLRQRLQLLYGKDFELHTSSDGTDFIASLKFPLL